VPLRKTKEVGDLTVPFFETLEEWERVHGYRLTEGVCNYWEMCPEAAQLPKAELEKWYDREIHEGRR